MYNDVFEHMQIPMIPSPPPTEPKPLIFKFYCFLKLNCYLHSSDKGYRRLDLGKSGLRYRICMSNST